MRAVIEGKAYDTDTAEEICDVSGGCGDHTDFHYDSSRLYRTKKGAFFIAGEGGAMSRWAKPVGGESSRSRGPGGGIQPMSEAEARQLVEKHSTASVYSEVFGEPEEA